jgi:hypothetical protein
VSPAYHLHPEFGLLCPSPRLRRKVRVALASLSFLVIVGALALKAGRDASVEVALPLAHGDEAPSNAPIIQTDGRATVTASAERSRALDGGESACEGDLWRLIDGKCSAGRTRRLQMPRAANEAAPIATLPLGRSAPLVPTSSVASADLAGVADGAGPTPAGADAPRLQAPAPKNVRKPSRIRHNDQDFQRGWSRRDDRWAAGTYAFSNDRYFGRYERSWGGSW